MEDLICLLATVRTLKYPYLRGANWVHFFFHRPKCTVTLNTNFTILKT